MTELENKSFELAEEFMHLELVKRYLRAKEIIDTDEELIKIRKEIKDEKSKLNDLDYLERENQIRVIKKKEDDYYSSSLMVTYLNLKEEVYYYLEKINKLFK